MVCKIDAGREMQSLVAISYLVLKLWEEKWKERRFAPPPHGGAG